jgi:hypothetical protein
MVTSGPRAPDAGTVWRSAAGILSLLHHRQNHLEYIWTERVFEMILCTVCGYESLQSRTALQIYVQWLCSRED